MSADKPEPEMVFEVLDDEACRRIVSTFDGPMTVQTISEQADVPVSTAYRKIEKLEQATLLRSETEVRRGGHHRSRYLLDFEQLVVLLDEARQFDINIARPLAEPERQLVGIWTELRRQT